jgi:hypothetical protein
VSLTLDANFSIVWPRFAIRLLSRLITNRCDYSGVVSRVRDLYQRSVDGNPPTAEEWAEAAYAAHAAARAAAAAHAATTDAVANAAFAAAHVSASASAARAAARAAEYRCQADDLAELLSAT